MTYDEFDLDSSRRFYARCIAEVLVYPKAHGERLKMRWQGSDELFVVPPIDMTAPVAA